MRIGGDYFGSIGRAAGTGVTITGSGFGAGSAVGCGTVLCPRFDVSSDGTQITAYAPEGVITILGTSRERDRAVGGLLVPRDPGGRVQLQGVTPADVRGPYGWPYSISNSSRARCRRSTLSF
ncbi:hypothetical protein [Nonomuraea sp. NPDC049141]|uniref:hypothetical protein n=1 Tax=unclassified Nonomuraea TaxID=2593643 RepID=UPI0034065069